MFVLNVIGKGAEPGLFRGAGHWAGDDPVARPCLRPAVARTMPRALLAEAREPRRTA